MTYNLLNESWIPVLYHNGDWKRVGILDVLKDASKIRRIAASNPMDRVAVLRFLLALLYWCKGNPPDDFDPDAFDSFPMEWFTKLEENRDCFELLGDGKRFYQDKTASRTRTITELFQEIPTGNNFWHFKHSTDEKTGICPACCALGLLRLPLYSVSGLPDLKSGINGTPPLYILPVRDSLIQTLLSNWKPGITGGNPAWVNPISNVIPNKNVPVLTGLSILSRRVRLHSLSENIGYCCNCGTATNLIYRCEFQSAGVQENKNWNDPHVILSGGKKLTTMKAQDLTSSGRFKMDRPWANIVSRLSMTKSLESGGSLLVVGFATNKAKNVDVWERNIHIPSLDGSNPEFTQLLIGKWNKSLEKRISKLLRPKEPEKLTKLSKNNKYEKSTLSFIRPHIENKVSKNISSMLDNRQTTWEHAADEYKPLMRSVAGSLSPGVTSKALKLRNDIAGIKPDMRLKEEKE